MIKRFLAGLGLESSRRNPNMWSAFRGHENTTDILKMKARFAALLAVRGAIMCCEVIETHCHNRTEIKPQTNYCSFVFLEILTFLEWYVNRAVSKHLKDSDICLEIEKEINNEILSWLTDTRYAPTRSLPAECEAIVPALASEIHAQLSRIGIRGLGDGNMQQLCDSWSHVSIGRSCEYLKCEAVVHPNQVGSNSFRRLSEHISKAVVGHPKDPEIVTLSYSALTNIVLSYEFDSFLKIS